jgi:hypothetical protein
MTGQSEWQRQAVVYVDELGRECTAEPYASYGKHLTSSSGEVLSAGSYSKEYPYTPTYVIFNPSPSLGGGGNGLALG